MILLLSLLMLPCCHAITLLDTHTRRFCRACFDADYAAAAASFAMMLLPPFAARCYRHADAAATLLSMPPL